MKLVIASIDRHSMSLEEYVAKCEKARAIVEQTFRDRAYKMLTIANPSNGDGFFQLIYNYDWSKKENFYWHYKLKMSKYTYCCYI